jgi:hypothetical protein
MVGEWSPQPGKNNKQQEETPCQKGKEDVANAALGRKGKVIHR